MHEATVIANIVDAVLEELQKYKVKKVNSVTMVVGDLTQLGYDQMEFAWSVLTEKNILQGAKIIFEPEHITVKCKDENCGYRGPCRMIDMGEDSFEHNIPVLTCPKCGGEVDVEEGMACRIKCMDVDLEEEERCSTTGTRRPRGRSSRRPRPSG
ncbi:MAG: hydrogenase maturation nickel metallochaperone HypA [Methanomethylophilus sp.]|jgi:hydrogenase nickel incorporation protein HypA/HybF